MIGYLTVPRFLPMNIWPGTYSVFGFYEPENIGSIHVTLTGKIGQEEVSVTQPSDFHVIIEHTYCYMYLLYLLNILVNSHLANLLLLNY